MLEKYFPDIYVDKKSDMIIEEYNVTDLREDECINLIIACSSKPRYYKFQRIIIDTSSPIHDVLGNEWFVFWYKP